MSALTPAAEYDALLVELDRLIAAGADESPAGEALRDRSDDLWLLLTPAERAAAGRRTGCGVPMSGVYASDGWRTWVAAVRADPASDLVRLTAADWLDDRGEAERAELIRVQCHHAAMPRTAATFDERVGLAFRAGDLLGRLGNRVGLPDGWRATTTGRALNDFPAAVLFQRGFVEHVRCPAAAWVAHGDALLAREPVREVRLTTVDMGWATPAQWRAAERTAGLAEDEYFGGGQSRADRVHRSLFSDRWPRVRFEMPPMRPATTRGLFSPPGGTEASPDRPRVTFGPRLTPEDGVIAGVAHRLGVDPGAVQRLRPPPPQSVHGSYRIRCRCGDTAERLRPGRGPLTRLSRPNEVVLEQHVFAAGEQRWGTWAGRCGGCRRVYATDPLLRDRLGDVAVTAGAGGVGFRPDDEGGE